MFKSFFSSGSTDAPDNSEWQTLSDESQLEEINTLSNDLSIKGVLIFKHSTRCGTSSMALKRFNSSWKTPKAEFPIFFLDLIRYRALSNKLAEVYGVHHESPQVLVISKGKCIYDASHHHIRVEDIPGL